MASYGEKSRASANETHRDGCQEEKNLKVAVCLDLTGLKWLIRVSYTNILFLAHCKAHPKCES